MTLNFSRKSLIFKGREYNIDDYLLIEEIMSQHHDKDEILEDDLMDQAQREESLYEEQEEIIEEQQEEISQDENEITLLKNQLARTQADYDNFKKRTDRDKSDTIFFLKTDIFKKILPRLDDLERIIKNTPEDMQSGVLYEGVLSLQKSLNTDLKKLGVTSFGSIGEEINPDMHEVMTQVPGKEGIIIDEFETGYMLNDRVLRVAKVVVGNGQ